MIILDRGADDSVPDTGELLEFLLGSSPASQLPSLVSYVEFDDINREATTENQHTVSNNTTPVTILDPPSDVELSRQVKAISIYNPNTGNVTVTLRFNDNATTRIILVTTLEPSDTLQYNDGEGFRVIDTNGNIKIIESNAPAEVFVLDQTNPSATTLTDAYTVPAGNTFEFFITVVNRSAVATSFRLSLAIAGAADDVSQYIAYDLPITGNNVYVTEDYKINTTDVIRVYATLATLTFTINGKLRA